MIVCVCEQRATQNKVLRNHHVTKGFHRLKANECFNIPYDTTTVLRLLSTPHKLDT